MRFSSWLRTRPAGDSRYDDPAAIASDVRHGRHRDVIGGLWDGIGQLQFEFLRNQGLQPSHRLLDVGCGSLRGGVHFVRYLEPSNYYGIDANKSLLDAGYEREISPIGLREKLPRENLVACADFESPFGVQFDFALAVSVWTHINWCKVRLCLDRIANVMAPGGTFFASYFELPDGTRATAALQQAPGIATYADKDPFHYRTSDLRQAAQALPWRSVEIGVWDHPRNQKMIAFIKT